MTTWAVPSGELSSTMITLMLRSSIEKGDSPAQVCLWLRCKWALPQSLAGDRDSRFVTGIPQQVASQLLPIALATRYIPGIFSMDISQPHSDYIYQHEERIYAVPYFAFSLVVPVYGDLKSP